MIPLFASQSSMLSTNFPFAITPLKYSTFFSLFSKLNINNCIQMKIIFLVFKQPWQRGSSDIVTNFSVLSNPFGAQNVSCMVPCGRGNCPKS